MLGYAIIFSFLIGFIFAVYMLLKCLPFMFDRIKDVSETNAKAAFAQGQNELYREFIGGLGRQNESFVLAAIDVVKDANKQAHPLPYQLAPPENGTHTHTHAPTHANTQENNDKKGEYDNVRLVLRTGVKDLGSFSWTVEKVKFMDTKGDYFYCALPQKGDKIAKFEGQNLYVGCCDNCNNRFVSKDVKTKYCQDSCKDAFHNSKY